MMILTLISRCQTIKVSEGKEMTYIQARKESLLQEADRLEKGGCKFFCVL